MPDLTDLIARVEAGEGADPGLDAEVCLALLGRHIGIPKLTTSLDAARALVPQGWDWAAESHGEDGAYGKVWRHGYHDDTVIHAQAQCVVRALLAAILRAKAGV